MKWSLHFMINSNSIHLTGNFENGLLSNNGDMYYPNGIKLYEGEVREGKNGGFGNEF